MPPLSSRRSLFLGMVTLPARHQRARVLPGQVVPGVGGGRGATAGDHRCGGPDLQVHVLRRVCAPPLNCGAARGVGGGWAFRWVTDTILSLNRSVGNVGPSQSAIDVWIRSRNKQRPTTDIFLSTQISIFSEEGKNPFVFHYKQMLAVCWIS